MTIAGTWDVTLRTPIGSLEVVYTFADTGDTVTGTAAGERETTVLTDIAVTGTRVTWRQAVTRPIRLNLEFDITIDGDTLDGYSRAGRLPRTHVCGVRRRP